MDGRGFDDFVRRLATQRSRRSVLRGLVGGSVAVVATKTGSALAADKVTICHFPPENPANVQVISVGSAALPEHQAHGDFELIDCCVDSECSGLTDQCNVDVCDWGTCSASPANEGYACVTEDGGDGVCSEGVCEPPSNEVPLFNCGPGYTCPTGATTFDPGGPLDPYSSAQALAACEACYGVGACYEEWADCAGPGWGPIGPGYYICGNAYFGYTVGCSGGPGRAWPICNSWDSSDYGEWGTSSCEGFRAAGVEASEDQGPTAPTP
jgi:hypothetical protein